ncbi:MAG: hypothetical protein II956_16075 [Bacteroidales bacterium]|nr:hypothetical protein [Bacteroidales bacterium]
MIFAFVLTAFQKAAAQLSVQQQIDSLLHLITPETPNNFRAKYYNEIVGISQNIDEKIN